MCTDLSDVHQLQPEVECERVILVCRLVMQRYWTMVTCRYTARVPYVQYMLSHLGHGSSEAGSLITQEVYLARNGSPQREHTSSGSKSKWVRDSVPVEINIQKVSVVCTHQVSTLTHRCLPVERRVVTLNVDGVGWSACKLVVLITYSLVE